MAVAKAVKEKSDAVPVEPVELTAADRCDKCGARAAHRFTLKTGELIFCAHHSAEFADALAKVSVTN